MEKVQVVEGQSTEQDATRIQAISGNITQERTVTITGKTFRLADRLGDFALMEFAAAARDEGEEGHEMDSLASVLDLLKDAIHPDDWAAFRRHARATKAGVEEMLPAVTKVVELMTARPTLPPSGSSDGPPTITATLTGSSSSGPGAASIP